MEDDKFCNMFLYALMNLICFVLTVIFLTTLYNIRSQTYLIPLKNKMKESYNNSFTAIATLFSFEFFGFIAFMFILMILVKKIKVNKVEFLRYQARMNIYNNNDNSQKNEPDNLNTNERIINSHRNDYEIQAASSVDIEGGKFTINNLEKVMLFLFVYCQIIFIIELIVLTAYFSKARNLVKEYEKKEYGEYFSDRYRYLMIVGYVFFVIFVFFDLFTLLMVTKCGLGPENEEEELEQANRPNKRYCDFCSNCIIETCSKMAITFKKCIKPKEQIKATIAELNKKEEELRAYIEKLEIVNKNIKDGKNVTIAKKDLEDVNLATYDYEIKTQVITINPK